MNERIRLVDLANNQASGVDISPEDWAKLRKAAETTVMANITREQLGKYRDPEAKKQVRFQVLQAVEKEYPGLPYLIKHGIVEKLADEISGYGPLDQLLDDDTITEVIVERYDKIVVEKGGKLHEVEVDFESEEHLRLVIERMIAPMGRRLDWASPKVDGRLPDGSRICAVAPPISPWGTQIAIRKFKVDLTIDDLIKFGALPEELKDAIQALVKARMTIIVSGGTGSGKSTFLNAISTFIDHGLSIITIENPIELQLDHPRVRQWEGRPPNIEGKGAIDTMFLVMTALRSRPDIIIVGEVRGPEAFALLQAINTGHDGSMTSLHANDTENAMERLVSMVSSAGQLAVEQIPKFVASGLDIVIHLSRMEDGSRKVVEISEVIGEENGEIKVNRLVEYKKDGFEGDKVLGHWVRTENKFYREKTLKEKGIDFPGWLGEEKK